MSTKVVVHKKSRPRNKSNRAHVEKYAGDAYDLAVSTARGLKAIKKLINVEEKYYDTITSAQSADSAGAVTNITGISQGTDIQNRVGDSIKLQMIRLQAWIRMNTSAVKTSVRVVLFRDMENAGAIPNPGDLFTGISNVQSPVVPYNFINTRTRFRILYDEVTTLSINGLEDAFLSVDIPHSGHVRFRGNSSAIGSMAQGCLFILVMSNETTTLLPDVTWFTRLEYTDD